MEGRPLGVLGNSIQRCVRASNCLLRPICLIWICQRLLAAATRSNRWSPQFKAYSTLPASERDLAMVVPRSLASGDLLQAIRKAGKPLLETVELIDRFEGGQLSDDQCSQAFRLRIAAKTALSPMSRFNRCTRRCAKRWSSNSRLSCAVDGSA